MPLMLAYGALLLWPLVTLGLFLTIPRRRAIIWSLLAGYLLLPISVNFDFPGVPPLNKDSIPCLATFVFALLLAPKGQFKWPRSPVVNLLMLVFVASPIVTGINNRDFLVDGTVTRPGMTLYDALSVGAGNAIILMPFLLGASFLRDERSHYDLLRIFTIACLAYSLPILWEIRFSPRLETQIYGVGSTEYFLQQMRGDGFRAKVFLGHGLLVSTFCAMGLLAAAGLWRLRKRVIGLPASLVALYLAGILVLNKSMGALVLAAVIVPLFCMLKPKRFAVLTLVAAAAIVTYPALRGMHLIPTEQLLTVTGNVSSDRASSFQFRLRNEEMLLDRAAERPWFGWGSFGRNRVFVVTSWGTTSDVTVTDGTWIILIGSFGWVGYFAAFGLLCYPFWRAFHIRNKGLTMAGAALAAMHILNLIDLIPNSSLRPMTWLIAGALSGAVAVRQARPARRLVPRTGPAPINAALPA